MKAPPAVRHYRNGPGIDVCLCGARGGAQPISWSQTMSGVTCKEALKKMRARKPGDPAWKARMAKIREGKRLSQVRTVWW